MKSEIWSQYDSNISVCKTLFNEENVYILFT